MSASTARPPSRSGMPAPSFAPLYLQIKEIITRSLAGGEWKPGDAIPAETELAERYGVSQGTVRKAIDALAADHLLIRRQGKGTFVATHTAPTHQYRFLRVRADDGGTVHPVTRFVKVERTRADTATAARLQLRVGASVTVIVRVLVFAGRALILDEISLANALFPGLTIEQLRASQGSIYSFLETAYGMRMIRAEERIKAVSADRFAAKHLDIPPSTPLLSVDRVAFTYDGRPVEWRRGRCLTDGFAYFNELA